MSSSAQDKNLPLGLFVLCLAVYALGVYLTRAFLCQPVGAYVLLSGVALGGMSTLMFAVSAAGRRSLGLALSALAIGGVSAFLYIFIGVLTLPGCSGI